MRHSILIAGLLFSGMVGAARGQVPNEVQQPGTQPREVSSLETPDKCDNCHGGYNRAIEPAHNWRGSMMAHAGRDPLFWATVAVAEQDFPGSGDLCIRCHSPAGWIAGRSTPTDGSALTAADADGVQCDMCHKSVNPDNSEHVGIQRPPFIAHDGGNPPVGYYGSGMYVFWPNAHKLGPYVDADARHQFLQSRFHRSNDFCGTCHDVSNPAVGDLAHNSGAQDTADPVIRDGLPGGPLEKKAAFNNFPYQYGVVERTYSEFMAGQLSRTLVADYADLPPELQAGAIRTAYESALGAGRGGNYEDSSPRYFSCQSCHLRPVSGPGCDKKGAPIRLDLPLHDMTGGNYWVPDAITFLDALGKLRLGGGLTTLQRQALADGQQRAIDNLTQSAALAVEGNMLRIVNLTAHKLISGYPEGRRMWVRVRWYDSGGRLLREDGRYGRMTVQLDGQPLEVETILDLKDVNTKIYEAHGALTQEWAAQLLAWGFDPALPLGYDRVSGQVTATLGELAARPPGSYETSFHFVLNNRVVSDNRIPPYGMSYDLARVRNVLPVPSDQFGDPGPGGVYAHWDELLLLLPRGARRAEIALLYQPTSWEYVQFLYLANTGQIPFLAEQGKHVLQAWLATGMAAPREMATATWERSGVAVPGVAVD
jgi:hypothetical protein